jgi:hypothetical protein
MKSGGQIDEQMSSQSPVVWWCREMNCEVAGMKRDSSAQAHGPFMIDPAFLLYISYTVITNLYLQSLSVTTRNRHTEDRRTNEHE